MQKINVYTDKITQWKHFGLSVCLYTQVKSLVEVLKVSTESFLFLHCWLCLSAMRECLQLLNSLLILKIAYSLSFYLF